MLSIMSNILLLLLVSASFPVGYLIGTYTESEIEKVSEKLGIDRFLNIYSVLLEVFVIVSLVYLNSQLYVTIAAIIVIINLALSAFYTAIKSDLVKIVGYAVEFLVFTLVISSIILL